jgi:type II restriction enzyme
MFCAACDSPSIGQTSPNTPAIDFVCERCGEPFQLKSSRLPFSNRVVDGSYEAMLRAIREDRTPNILLLQYSSDWRIDNLELLPRFCFSESFVQKRKPLSATARRAGWVGCNLLLGQLLPDARIGVVIDSITAESSEVRRRFAKLRPLNQLPPSLRGWTLEVYRGLVSLQKQRFTLQEAYKLERSLHASYPGNNNVRSKIRQQLQILRDLGMLNFIGGGEYSLPG